MSKIYEFTVKDANQNDYQISDLKGKAFIVVNVASKCGLTYHYEGLEDIYKKYKDKGLEILGFPCNQFGGQEPGTNEEIQSFCSLKYDVTFPILNKIEVNGSDADPFYKYLKDTAPGVMGTKNIKWNFTKFLINQDGEIVKRFGPRTEPKEMLEDIEAVLV